MNLGTLSIKKFSVKPSDILFPDMIDMRRMYKGLCAYPWCKCKVYTSLKGDLYCKSKKHKRVYLNKK